jgi:hypothetical protein
MVAMTYIQPADKGWECSGAEERQPMNKKIGRNRKNTNSNQDHAPQMEDRAAWAREIAEKFQVSIARLWEAPNSL